MSASEREHGRECVRGIGHSIAKQETMPLPSLIVFDLDGTLLRSDRTVSERTTAALNACQAAGIQLAIASARGAAAIRLVVPPVLADSIWVAHNGALVVRANHILHSIPLPRDTLASVVEFAYHLDPPALLVAEIDLRPYANRDVSALWGAGFHTADFRTLGAVEVAKVLLELPDGVDVRELERRLPPGTGLLVDRHGFLIVQRVNVSKHQALTTCLNELGLDWHQLCAFGDDIADVGMLRAAGTSVAMGNAIAAVKASAQHFTATNDEDGVALFLEQQIATGWVRSGSER